MREFGRVPPVERLLGLGFRVAVAAIGHINSKNTSSTGVPMLVEKENADRDA